MRWSIEVTPTRPTPAPGDASPPAELYVVEAKSWQTALQEARAQDPSAGPISQLSIELLADGYRATDPSTKVRYLVRKTAADTPLRSGKDPVSSPTPASAPEATPASAPAPVSAPTPPSAPAPSVTPASAPASEPASTLPMSPTPAASASPSAPTVSAPPPAPAAPAASTPPSAPATTVASSVIPPTSVAPPAPAVAPVSDPDALPPFDVVMSREEQPSEKSPLTYRETVYSVPPGTSEQAAERLLRKLWADIAQQLWAAPPGKFINLAVFDVAFSGRPPKPPLVTLPWKDWRGSTPDIAYPLRQRTSQAPPSGSSIPPVAIPANRTPSIPPVSVAPPTQIPPTVQSSASPEVIAPSKPSALPERANVVPADPPSVEIELSDEESATPAPVEVTPAAPVQEPVVPAAVEAPATPPEAPEAKPTELAAKEAPEVPAVVEEAPKGAIVTEEPRVEAAREEPPAKVETEAPRAASEDRKAPEEPRSAEAPKVIEEPEVDPPVEAAKEAPKAEDPSPEATVAEPPKAEEPKVETAPDTKESRPEEPSASEVKVAPQAEEPRAEEPRAEEPRADEGKVAEIKADEPPRTEEPKESAASEGNGLVAEDPFATPPKEDDGKDARGKAVKKKRRLSGDDLLGDLFEAMHDVHFQPGVLEGAHFVLWLAVEKMPCKVAVCHLFDINRREFVITHVLGECRKELLLKRASEREALIHQVVRRRRAVVLAGNDPLLDGERWKLLGQPVRSAVAAPVVLGGRFLGLLELINPMDGAPFVESDGYALAYIGEQFAEFLGQRGLLLDPEAIANFRPPKL